MGRKPLSEALKELNRQKIIDAAGLLLQNRSFEKLTMSDVADQAGIAKGTVFLYFPGKDELLLQLSMKNFSHWFEDFAAELSESANHGQADVELFLGCLKNSLNRHAQVPRFIHEAQLRDLSSSDEYSHSIFLSGFSEILSRGGSLIELVFPYLQEGTGHLIFARIVPLLSSLTGFGRFWREYSSAVEIGAEDMQTEGDGQSLVMDFFIHSVRRLLKGYSLQ